MTTKTLEQAQGKQLTGKDQVKDLLEQNKDFIAQALPKHMNPDRMLRTAITAYTTTPALKECYVPSLIGAVVACAIMGLEPNTPLGHAYMIPFNNKKKNRKEVQVIFGYAGLIELMRRSGNLISINAGVVRVNDTFEFEYGLNQRLKHVPCGNLDGEITHFYAYANLKDGGQQFTVLTKAEINGVMRKTQSKGDYGPWKDHYAEMGKKTAIRRLSKYMPKSIELSQAVAMDEFVDMQKGQHLETALTDDYTIEGEIDDSEPEETAPDPFDAGYGHKKNKVGEDWNPDQHATSVEGYPVWNQDGSFRAKRQAKPTDTADSNVNPLAPEPQIEPEVPAPPEPGVTFDGFVELLDKATDDDHDICEDIINSLNPAVQMLARKKLNEKFPSQDRGME